METETPQMLPDQITTSPESLEKISNNGSKGSAAFYSGPLPPATELAKYDTIVDGAANRIIAMAEKAQEHKHWVDKEVLNLETNKIVQQSIIAKQHHLGTLLGLMCAFIITLVAFGVAFWLGMNKHDWLAGVIITELVGIISVFFIIRNIITKKQAEDARKEY